MKIAVVAKYSPAYEDIAQITIQNKQDYCDCHGYTFILNTGTIDYSRPLNWTKIQAIKEHLSDFDWLFWSDIDSLFVNMGIKLENVIKDNVSLITSLFTIVKDPTRLWEAVDQRLLAYTLHTGNFLIKNNSIGHRVTNYLYNNKEWENHDLMDEAALTYFYRNCADIREQTLLLNIRELCTVPENNMMRWIFPVYTPGDFIVHFLGKEYTMEQKLRHIEQFIRNHL